MVPLMEGEAMAGQAVADRKEQSSRRYKPLVLSRGCLRPYYCPCTRSLCLLVFSPSCKHPRAQGLPEKSFNGIVGIWITRNTIRDQNLVALPLPPPSPFLGCFISKLELRGRGPRLVYSYGPRRCPPGLIVGSSSSSIRSSIKISTPSFFFPFLPFPSRDTNFRSYEAGLGWWLHIQRCKIEIRFLEEEEDIESYWKIIPSYVYVSWKNVSMVHSSFGIGYPHDINFHVTRIEC